MRSKFFLLNNYTICRIGYHAVPSMHRLHLHVISTDFDSRCMKTIHHWNTFTTPYFISSKGMKFNLILHLK